MHLKDEMNNVQRYDHHVRCFFLISRFEDYVTIVVIVLYMCI